jgi:hypothetical protein
MVFDDAGSEEEAFFCRLDQRSKKRRFAFQTFAETPATTPSTLGFGISHQPHGSGGWCGIWSKIAFRAEQIGALRQAVRGVL